MSVPVTANSRFIAYAGCPIALWTRTLTKCSATSVGITRTRSLNVTPFSAPRSPRLRPLLWQWPRHSTLLLSDGKHTRRGRKVKRRPGRMWRQLQPLWLVCPPVTVHHHSRLSQISVSAIVFRVSLHTSSLKVTRILKLDFTIQWFFLSIRRGVEDPLSPPSAHYCSPYCHWTQPYGQCGGGHGSY